MTTYPVGLKAFIEACPKCKNSGSDLCYDCKNEVKSNFEPKDKENKKMKYNYHVAIIRPNNTVEYVTRIDTTTKTFYCEKGKPAKKFTKTSAEDLVYGMTLNCCPAGVIKVPEHLELSNKEESVADIVEEICGG